MKYKTVKGFIYLATGLLLTTSFAGLVSGTVAWYAYSSRVTMTYQGTTVANAERVQIGLKSNVDFTVDDQGDPYENVNLTKQVVEGEDYDYYWANPGSGFSSEAIARYLEKQGRAVDKLEPCTTREYKRDNSKDFRLKYAPSAYELNLDTDAKTSSYCKIDFVFRVLVTTGTSELVFAAGEQIWLSDCDVSVSSATGGDIDKAMRLYFDGINYAEEGEHDVSNQRFILNPKAASDGATNVSGCLDFNDDGMYDTDSNGYEIIYGDYGLNEEDMKASSQVIDDSKIPVEGIFTDINRVYNTDEYIEEERSTFLANHRKGCKGYTREAMDARQTKQADYYCLNSVAPHDDSQGRLAGGKPLCTTSYTDKVANVSMTIYLEGWDFFVVDKEINHSFNLGLEFKINRE